MSNLDQHNQLAEDLVAAYNSADEGAVARLNALFHSAINADQIRHFVRDRLMFLPQYEQHTFDVLTLADAQQLFASIYGFKDWAAAIRLATASSSASSALARSASEGWARRPGCRD